MTVPVLAPGAWTIAPMCAIGRNQDQSLAGDMPNATLLGSQAIGGSMSARRPTRPGSLLTGGQTTGTGALDAQGLGPVAVVAPRSEALGVQFKRGDTVCMSAPKMPKPAPPPQEQKLPDTMSERRKQRQVGMGGGSLLTSSTGASVSGWYFAHPKARYFGVGQINRDQVADYARRKGMDAREMERWLSPNLGYEPD